MMQEMQCSAMQCDACQRQFDQMEQSARRLEGCVLVGWVEEAVDDLGCRDESQADSGPEQMAESFIRRMMWMALSLWPRQRKQQSL